MHSAHVVRIYPSGDQATLLKRSCGVARQAYNEMRNMWGADYEAGLKPNWVKIQKKFVARVDTEFPYMREVSHFAYYQPARHLNAAFSKFFKKTAEYPQPKKKGIHDSFKCGRVTHNEHTIIVAKIGKLRAAEFPRFVGKVVSATVSHVADTWEISILYDTSVVPVIPKSKRPVVGVDLGIKTTVTLSSGETFQSPKPLKRYLRKLKRAQRAFSRRKKGSKRKAAQRVRVARIHRRISNIRQDFLHKVTSKITDENQVIVLEDLNVKGMLKNHRLARAISDIGFREFRRQIEYKAKRKGREVRIADRFFPSSKRCQACGHIHKGLTLADRVFECPNCGHTADRDLNAACNLEALSSTRAQRGSNGRGEAKAKSACKGPRASSTKRQLGLNVGKTLNRGSLTELQD